MPLLKRKAPAKKAPAKKVSAKKPKIKILGKVVHYYDKLGVAVVDLNSPVKVGDVVFFKREGDELIQTVGSLHIEHENVEKAKKGQVVGMKVDEKVKEGALMLPVEV